MYLGEFREKTKDLADNTVMVMHIEEKMNGSEVVREGIGMAVNTLDFDKGVNGEDILTMTNEDPGSYSL